MKRIPEKFTCFMVKYIEIEEVVRLLLQAAHITDSSFFIFVVHANIKVITKRHKDACLTWHYLFIDCDAIPHFLLWLANLFNEIDLNIIVFSLLLNYFVQLGLYIS